MQLPLEALRPFTLSKSFLLLVHEISRWSCFLIELLRCHFCQCMRCYECYPASYRRPLSQPVLNHTICHTITLRILFPTRIGTLGGAPAPPSPRHPLKSAWQPPWFILRLLAAWLAGMLADSIADFLRCWLAF